MSEPVKKYQYKQPPKGWKADEGNIKYYVEPEDTFEKTDESENLPEEIRDILKFAAPPKKNITRYLNEKRIQEGHKKRANVIRPVAKDNEDGSVSSHLMATETFDGDTWYSFPTLFPKDPKNPTKNPEDWIEIKDRKEAFEEAKKRGEVFEFGTDKKAALEFGEGSWKGDFDPNNKNHQVKSIDDELTKLREQRYEITSAHTSTMNPTWMGPSGTSQVENPEIARLDTEIESLMKDRDQASGDLAKIRKSVKDKILRNNPSTDYDNAIKEHFIENGTISEDIRDQLKDEGFSRRQIDNITNEVETIQFSNSLAKLGQKRIQRTIVPEEAGAKELNAAVNHASKDYANTNFFDDDEKRRVEINDEITELQNSESSYDLETKEMKETVKRKIEELEGEFINLNGSKGWLDPKTGFRYPTNDNEGEVDYSNEVNDEITFLRAQISTKEKLEKIMRERFYAFDEIDRMYKDLFPELHDVTRNLSPEEYAKESKSRGSLRVVSGSEASNVKDMHREAKIKLEAASRLYHLNQTPKEVKYAEGGKAKLLLSGLSETLLGQQISHALIGSDPIKQTQAISEILNKGNIALTPKELEEIETTNVENIIYGAGAIGGVIGQFAVLDKIGAAAGMTKILSFLKVKGWGTPAMKAKGFKGSNLFKVLSFLSHATYEEAKFSVIGGERGAGALFYTASTGLRQIKIPGLSGKLNMFQRALKTLATADLSMTAAADMSHVMNEFAHNLESSEDFKYMMKQYFGTSTDEVLNKYIVDFSTNWIFGVRTMIEEPRQMRANERARLEGFSKQLEYIGDFEGANIVKSQIEKLKNTKSVTKLQEAREKVEADVIKKTEDRETELRNDFNEKAKKKKEEFEVNIPEVVYEVDEAIDNGEILPSSKRKKAERAVIRVIDNLEKQDAEGNKKQINELYDYLDKLYTFEDGITGKKESVKKTEVESKDDVTKASTRKKIPATRKVRPEKDKPDEHLKPTDWVGKFVIKADHHKPKDKKLGFVKVDSKGNYTVQYSDGKSETISKDQTLLRSLLTPVRGETTFHENDYVSFGDSNMKWKFVGYEKNNGVPTKVKIRAGGKVQTIEGPEATKIVEEKLESDIIKNGNEKELEKELETIPELHQRLSEEKITDLDAAGETKKKLELARKREKLDRLTEDWDTKKKEKIEEKKTEKDKKIEEIKNKAPEDKYELIEEKELSEKEIDFEVTELETGKRKTIKKTIQEIHNDIKRRISVIEKIKFKNCL